MTWKLVLPRQCQCFWLFRTSIWTFWMSQIPSKFHQNSIRSSRNRHEQSMFNRCLHLRTWSKMQNVYNFRIVSPAMLARELNVLPEPSGLEGHVGCRWLIEEGWSWPGRGCYWWPLQQGRLVIQFHFYSDLTATSQKIMLRKRNYPSKISHCILCPVAEITLN